MKIRFAIDRNAAIRAGSDTWGEVIVEVPVDTFTPEERELMTQFPRETGCDIAMNRAPHDHSSFRGHKLAQVNDENGAECVRSVLQALREHMSQKADEKAAQEAECVEAIKTWMNLPADERVVEGPNYSEITLSKHLRNKAQSLDIPGFEEKMRETVARHDMLNQVMREKYQRAVEARKVREEQARQELLAKQNAALKMHKAWIEGHGSTRLKAHLKEGIEYGAIFRDEWMAKERPDWFLDPRTDLTEEDVPRNVPEETLRMLDIARKQEPSAVLVWLPEMNGWTCTADINIIGDVRHSYFGFCGREYERFCPYFEDAYQEAYDNAEDELHEDCYR